MSVQVKFNHILFIYTLSKICFKVPKAADLKTFLHFGVLFSGKETFISEGPVYAWFMFFFVFQVLYLRLCAPENSFILFYFHYGGLTSCHVTMFEDDQRLGVVCFQVPLMIFSLSLFPVQYLSVLWCPGSFV